MRILGRRSRFRCVARVDELMAPNHRRTAGMVFYGNTRELSEEQLWEDLGTITNNQRGIDDADKLKSELSVAIFVLNHFLSPTTWLS